MHSFIKPRKKKLIDDMSLLWLIFIVLMFIGLLGFGIFVNYKSSFYIKALQNSQEQNKIYSENIQGYKKDLKIANMKQILYNEVKSNNIILKKSVKNLFDLVPDQITLTNVIMTKEELLLKGYSISKDNYTLLLEPPLKSIFDKSEVVFSKNNRGFYSFISKNSISNTKSIKNDKK
jgi:hypothetical protein